jgi:hypothetical protein
MSNVAKRKINGYSIVRTRPKSVKSRILARESGISLRRAGERRRRAERSSTGTIDPLEHAHGTGGSCGIGGHLRQLALRVQLGTVYRKSEPA